jgi:WD40 repeat protein
MLITEVETMKKHLTIILLSLLICCASSQQQKEHKTLWTVAWSPDGKYIAAGGNQDELKLFDAKTFTLIKTFPVKEVQLSRIKWHPTQNKLAIITQSRTIKASILDVDKETWTNLKGLESGFRALDWNWTGNLLAVSELDDAVSVYTIDGTLVSRFMADPKAVADLDWHPNKNVMVTVGSQIGIYTQYGDTLKTFKPRTREAFLLCIEWHKSGEFFVVGDYGDLEKGDDKWLQFWDVEGRKLNEIHGSIGEYRNIKWNPNGTKLATASDALRIWTEEALLLDESKSTDDYLWGEDWSPDGKYIITSSSNGKIVIWDDKAKVIKTLQQ